MEYFTEDHAQILLSKEWFSKVDNDKSIPYLMKFYSTSADQKCILVISDTKIVWAEVLSRQRLARRWAELNPGSSGSTSADLSLASEEWLDQVLQCVSDMHALGNIEDCLFEVTESNYADLSVQLRIEGCLWRWDTFAIGPRFSAELLSRQLIMPLVSVAHLAFTSSSPLGQMSESDLEKAIDKAGRAARRGLDTHLKNTIMRARVTTALRRTTASLFNFNTAPPLVLSEADKPVLKIPSTEQLAVRTTGKQSALRPLGSTGNSKHEIEWFNPMPVNREQAPSPSLSTTKDKQEDSPDGRIQPSATPQKLAELNSETEPEDDETALQAAPVPQKPRSSAIAEAKPPSWEHQKNTTSQDAGSRKPKGRVLQHKSVTPPSSDSEAPPSKKRKPSLSDCDSDSDTGGGRSGTSARRGARQPIKRSGRRF